MSHRIRNAYTKELDKVVTHLREQSSSAFVFVNTRQLLNNLATDLEDKLDKIGISADVMNIHGKQGKSEKFALIGIFCGNIAVEDYEPCVLIATAAADLGINHPDEQCILNLEWPDCITTLVQRRGRAYRAGEVACFIVVVGITSFLI